jgi:hypothetical protein
MEVADAREPDGWQERCEAHSATQMATQNGESAAMSDLRKANQPLQDLLRRPRHVEAQAAPSRVQLQTLETRCQGEAAASLTKGSRESAMGIPGFRRSVLI